MSIDVLGGVVAAINRSDLEGAVTAYVTGPLGMADTHFFVSDKARLAHPYGDGKPRPFRMSEPQPIEENGTIRVFSPKRIFQSRAPQSGGSGMAGTAADFMKLLEALRAGPFLTSFNSRGRVQQPDRRLAARRCGSEIQFRGRLRR